MSRVIDHLYQHAKRQPENVALSTKDERVTWRELGAGVSELAEWLRGMEITTLAFRLDNSIAWAMLDLAALAAGVRCVPIPVFFSESQVRHVLTDAAVDVFVDEEPEIEGLAGDIIMSPPSGIRTIRMNTERASEAPPGAGKITYTSGSTGTPKGVCLDAAVLDDVTMGVVEAMAKLDLQRHLCVLPLATLLENIAGFYAPIVRGIEVRIAPRDEIGVDAGTIDINRFADTINTVQPDSVILVPQLLMALVTLVELDLVHWDHPQMIAVGGGRVSEQLLWRAQAAGLPVYQGYGLSECASVVTLCLPDANRPGSVGRPLPHARIRVSEHGEIEVAGPRMTGYLGDTPVDGEWYPTGDLGRVDDDGYVYIDGRARNVFITAFGRNVNPEWVESALTQQAAIASALIWGEGTDHNLALLWLRFPLTDKEVAEAVATANAELPDYARVHAWQVVHESLPTGSVTANGRLKREMVVDHFHHLIDNHFQQGGCAVGIL